MASEHGPNDANLGRPDPVPQPRPIEKAGSVAEPFPVEIAGYRIQRELGSGGMATVFAATQSHPRRIVALKVMKPGLAADGSKAAHRRFRREVEILGKLHHPYIAQVYEAGVHGEDGPMPVPYFVMEYVGGAKTILEYIAANQLELRDRLRLFSKVCAGVEHAHRNKVIHRDLKPSNILIDEYGQPKIIDFGVAHAIEQDVISHTMNTEAGRLVGTLSYMSPEQVDGQPTDLDARCDVYALGALLYKMLTGRALHDLDGKSVYQAVRVIREATPLRPSELKPELRGDLETIILKAIEHDRSRRYRGAGSLGRDVVRFLEHLPIHARRAGLLHGARLFAKRHRPALTAGAIATLVIAAGLTVIAFERIRMNRVQRGDGPALPSLGQTDPPPTPPSDRADNGGAGATGGFGAPPDSPPNPQDASQRGEPRQAFDLKVHTGRVNELAIASSGDDVRVASVSNDHKLMVCSLSNPRVLVELDLFKQPVTRVCISGDGRFAAAAAEAEPLQIISIDDSRVVRTIQHRSGAISALAMSADGSRLAFAGEDFTVRVISTQAGEAALPAVNELTLRSGTGMLTCIAFDPDGTRILAGSQQGPAYLWQLSDGKLIRRFNEIEGELAAVAFGASEPDGDVRQRVMAISRVGRAHVWSSKSWGGGVDDPILASDFNALEVSRGSHGVGNAGAMSAAAFSRDGRCLAVAMQSRLILWDMFGNKPKEEGAHAEPQVVIDSSIVLEEPATALAIDPGRQWCAVGDLKGNIRAAPITK